MDETTIIETKKIVVCNLREQNNQWNVVKGEYAIRFRYELSFSQRFHRLLIY